MLPRPSTAVPSVTMATVFFLIVSSCTRSGRASISRAHAGDARRVRHREVVAVADRHAGQDLDLAAVVHVERAVADREDLDAVDVVDGGTHLGDVGLAGAVDDEVLVEDVTLGLEALQRHDVAACAADGDGQPTEGARHVVEPDADRDGVGGGGCAHGGRR